MYLQENFISLTRGQVRQQNILGSSPYSFTNDGLHLEHNKESFKCAKLRQLKRTLATFYLFVLWGQLLHEIKTNGKLTAGTKLANYFYALTSSTITLQKWATLKHSKNTIELFNLFVEFENRSLMGSEVPRFLSKSYKFLMQLCTLGLQYGIPFIMVGFAVERWIIPCNSATAGYLLFPECDNGIEGPANDWSLQSQLGLLSILLVTLWMNTDSFSCFGLHLVQFSFLQSICLRNYLTLFAFRLNGMSKNKNLSYNNFLLYRQLQVLNRYYNLIQQNVLLTSMLLLVTNGLVVSAYVMLSNGRSVTFQQLFMFLNGGLNCFLIIVIQFGAMSKLYGESVMTIQNVGKSLAQVTLDPNRSIWIRKYMRSLTPLKVSLGSVNFMDELTPINLLNFCLMQIVNLLLL
ncbi:unnamed protein product [Orchesella dallaii]|uniref:Odorant receptor n=1 Tax=Orchesella dallaii TaxID=48710 RepID=A0ABP1RID1_9HEXA